MNPLSEKSRMEQLMMSFKIISAALKRFDIDPESNKEEVAIIASQLRAIICSGGRNFHPLLLELAEDKKIKLFCYGPQDLRKLPAFVKEAQLFYVINIISLDPQERRVRYELKDWMQSEIIILQQIVFTPNEILRLKADSEASHYDPGIRDKLELLKTIQRQSQAGQISEPDFYVIEIARVVSELAKLFV